LAGIVLDTNLVSEPKRARPDARVVAWYARQAVDDLYLTSTVVAELAFGIELLPAGRRRRSFEVWLSERVLALFASRILPLVLCLNRFISPALKTWRTIRPQRNLKRSWLAK
jgi:predicted nucleic acid-binding protein